MEERFLAPIIEYLIYNYSPNTAFVIIMTIGVIFTMAINPETYRLIIRFRKKEDFSKKELKKTLLRVLFFWIGAIPIVYAFYRMMLATVLDYPVPMFMQNTGQFLIEFLEDTGLLIK
jgi:glucose uptake protein GlcU